MAKMHNHRIVEVWRDKKNPNVTFHIDDNDRVLMVFKKAMASAKLLFVTENGTRHGLTTLKDGLFNFQGLGRRATATEYRARLEARAVRES